MAYLANVYRVMVASPGDLAEERNVIKEVIQDWNIINSSEKSIVLLPVGWETHSAPSMGKHPQEVINKQVLENSDLLIGVFWTRIGTPTGNYVSGTVEEIDRHIKSGKPAMLYFSTVPVRLDSIEHEQYEQLKRFKEECLSRGLVETFDSISELKDKLTRQLTITVNSNDFFKSPDIEDHTNSMDLLASHIPTRNSQTLSDKEKKLLVEAAKDKNGIVMKSDVKGGLIIETNQKKMNEQGNPRSEAAWEEALDNLVRMNLLNTLGYNENIFKVTNEGYQIADILG